MVQISALLSPTGVFYLLALEENIKPGTCRGRCPAPGD